MGLLLLRMHALSRKRLAAGNCKNQLIGRHSGNLRTKQKQVQIRAEPAGPASPKPLRWF
jgi:hypothetical protein